MKALLPPKPAAEAPAAEAPAAEAAPEAPVEG
jgi:polyribonucleotide nucleotidyltransferase